LAKSPRFQQPQEQIPFWKHIINPAVIQ